MLNDAMRASVFHKPILASGIKFVSAMMSIPEAISAITICRYDSEFAYLHTFEYTRDINLTAIIITADIRKL